MKRGGERRHASSSDRADKPLIGTGPPQRFELLEVITQLPHWREAIRVCRAIDPKALLAVLKRYGRA